MKLKFRLFSAYLLCCVTAAFTVLLSSCASDTVTVLPTDDAPIQDIPAAAVEQLSLNQTEVSLMVGESTLLVPIVTPLDAENRGVLFESSDPAVVAVRENGHITALARGSATVTATTLDGGIAAFCTVTVRDTEHYEDEGIVRVSGITISETSKYMAVGDTLTLTAAVLPENAFYQGISWVNSNTRSISMEEDGVLKAIAPGRSVITVISEDGEYSATCEIQVYAKLEGLLLSSRYLSLKPGAKATLTSSPNPANAAHYNGYTWKSSNSSVVTVDQKGNLVAKGYGSATVTVTASGTKVSASCKVTVEDKVSYIPLNSFTLSQTKTSLSVGEHLTLFVNRVPVTSNEVLRYTSSDSKILSVTQDGRVTALGQGEATVTVSSSDGVLQQSCTVTVYRESVGHHIYFGLDQKTLSVGETFAVDVGFSTPIQSGEAVLFSVSNPGILSVDQNGVVKALAVGEAYVYGVLSKSGYTARFSVTVTAPSIDSLLLSEEQIILEMGSRYALKATVLPSGASSNGLLWTSSNPNLVSVDAKGMLTVHHAGKAVITVTSPDKTRSASCTVIAVDSRITALSFEKDSYTLAPGTTLKLTLKITPANAETGGISFTSSDTSILTVASDGTVTTKAEGTATVYAINPSGGSSARCTITVTAMTSDTAVADADAAEIA